MNIAKYAMNNRQVIHLFLIIALFGGIIAFNNLGKQEDAPFQVKRAVILTQYPGATQLEVEELVTEPIEKEVQSMGQVFWIKSESKPGLSTIWVEMYPWFVKEDLPGIWDELRRKVIDVSGSMPPGAGQIQVNDAFGDVFGVYYGLSADEGFEYSELEDYADFIKRELRTVQDVAKVDLYGIQKQVINVEVFHEKLGAANLNPKQVMATLQAQNKVVASGRLPSGKRDLRVETFGTFRSISEIENLLIVGQNKNQLTLKDVANVSRGYFEPATTKFRVNGKPAIGIGISTVAGGNSVVMGDEVAKKLNTIMGRIPVGINLEGLYFQNEIAVEANNDFIINLIISISIVTIIILFIMGVRAGVLIGSSLIFSILGTLLFMLVFGIDLHRTSLAAIIIAMGMLVDNAIVVTDNAMVQIGKGMKRSEALIKGASGPQWALFGATIIAILSFLPLQLAPANAAEVIKPLFYVLAISLFLSWIFALVQTPVYGDMILKE
ncbi:MAG: efflux RND transporter permease subunit, partial [Melioribacteraceae bacterium]|nr:efflux RND transporter permease subunit [Melioribacteraceae bacterium]